MVITKTVKAREALLVDTKILLIPRALLLFERIIEFTYVRVHTMNNPALYNYLDGQFKIGEFRV